MARERKTTNFFEILKLGSVQKQGDAPQKESETPRFPVAPVVMPVPVKAVAPVSPAPPPVAPIVVPRPVPVVPAPPKVVPPPTAVSRGPVPPPVIPLEPILHMSYTTALFLFLLFSSVPFVTYSLGRETGPSAPSARSRSTAPERPAPRREDQHPTPASSSTGTATPTRNRTTIRLLTLPAGNPLEARESRSSATMLDQILRGRGLKEMRVKEQGGYLVVVYGSYPDSTGSQVAADLKKLRETPFRGSNLNPRTQDMER